MTEREINSSDDDVFSQMNDKELCRLEQEAKQTGTASPTKWAMDKFQSCLRRRNIQCDCSPFFLSWHLTPRYNLKTARALPGELLGKLMKLTLRTSQ